MGKRGIGGKMVELVFKLMKTKGMKLCYAECTSIYPVRALLKLGGEIKHTIPYNEWRYPTSCGGSIIPFKDTPAPHDACNLVVFKL